MIVNENAQPRETLEHHSYESVEKLQERVADMVLSFLVIVGLIALAGSLYRIRIVGWQPALRVQAAAVISIYFVYGIRRRLPVKFKVWYLIFICFISGFSGLINFGVTGSGMTMMTASTILGMSLLGIWYGLGLLMIGALSIAAIGSAYLSGFWTYPFTPSALITSLPPWVNLLTTYVLAAGILSAVVGVMNMSFMNSLKNLKRRGEDLEREIAQREEVQAALAVSEKNYREIFEATTDAIFIHHVDTGEIIDVNHAMLDMFGYTLEEAKGLTVGQLSSGLPSYYSQEDALTWIRKARDEGPQRFEWVFKRKNGEEFWVEVKLKKARIGGELRILASVRDISNYKTIENDLRSSLNEKEVLLREIHHRVKSNLQSISGLLEIQGHYEKTMAVQKALKDTRFRIRTMALIHETLYQSSDMTGINMKEFVGKLAGNLAISFGADPDRIAMKLDVDDVSINMDTAIPAGLIINELVSNALIHAFPRQGRGQVRITFRALGDSWFQLKVADNGIGMPAGHDIGNSSTLGMQLVTSLGQQLGSELKISTDRGTLFELQFKEYFEAGAVLY